MNSETLSDIIEFVALNFVPITTDEDVIHWQTSYHNDELKYTTNEIIELFLQIN